MDGIASRAGVGIGTLYRRFAGKEALIDALVGLVMDDLEKAADRSLTASDGTGLQSFLLTLGESFAAHRRYAGLMLGRGDTAGVERIRGHLEELTRRAVVAGAVGPQTSIGDVMALVWSVRALAEIAEDVAPGLWRRHLDIHLAGLRAPGQLSGKPVMTAEQIRAISSFPVSDHHGRRT